MQYIAWFVVYLIPLSRLLRMRVMATPYIFLFNQININETFIKMKKKPNLNI